MNISKVITFLIAGIVIGAILFFAGFGVVNLLDKNAGTEMTSQGTAAPPAVSDPVSTAPPPGNPVNPPTIQITPGQTDVPGQAVTVVTPGQGTSRSPIRIKPLGSTQGDEPTSEGQQLPTIAFGTLRLSTVNAVDNAPVNADFLIQNADNVALASVKDTANTTLSLPAGDYKITVNQGAREVVRFLGVKEGQNGAEVFELDVPTLTDEAPPPSIVGGDTAAPAIITPPTPAPPTPLSPVADAPPAAEPATQVASETPGAQPNDAAQNTDATAVTPSVAANETGSDSTASGNTNAIGGLRLSALSQQGKRPINASFDIQRMNGQTVKTFSDVKTQQLTLPAGDYKVIAKTETATLTREVKVLATKGVHEIFLMAQRTPTPTPTSTSTPASTPASGSAGTNNTARNSDSNDDKKTSGKLELFAQRASDSRALKSNFYVQQPNGKMVVSKVYVDSIGYRLPAGKYNVIVRATGYKNESVALTVREGQTRRQVFKLKQVNRTTAPAVAPATRTPPTPAAAPTNNTRPYGGLTVNTVDASNGAALTTDIVVTRRDGTQVKRATGVASASFDLPPNEFLIRVTYNGLTTSHQVTIVADKLAIKTISFTKR